MKVIDSHCDAILKLWYNQNLQFNDSKTQLDASLENLSTGNVKIQFFAIFVPPSIRNANYSHIKKMIHIFQERILQENRVIFIKNQKDMHQVFKTNRIGAILTLEGVDALQGQINKLSRLFEYGVRFIGITWNKANWAADGIYEYRKDGFSNKGKQLINEMDRLGIIADVSHLSERCFWKLNEITTKPVVASHSNAKRICSHSRNLSDQQIKAIIDCQGMIGLTFVPHFISKLEHKKMYHIIRHIEHICTLGGEYSIGFGSDFDGMKSKILGLEHPGKYINLIEELYKYYTHQQIEMFLSLNWVNFLKKHLAH